MLTPEFGEEQLEKTAAGNGNRSGWTGSRMQENEEPGEATERHGDHREGEVSRRIGKQPVDEVLHAVTLAGI